MKVSVCRWCFSDKILRKFCFHLVSRLSTWLFAMCCKGFRTIYVYVCVCVLAKSICRQRHSFVNEARSQKDYCAHIFDQLFTIVIVAMVVMVATLAQKIRLRQREMRSVEVSLLWFINAKLIYRIQSSYCVEYHLYVFFRTLVASFPLPAPSHVPQISFGKFF